MSISLYPGLSDSLNRFRWSTAYRLVPEVGPKDLDVSIGDPVS